VSRAFWKALAIIEVMLFLFIIAGNLSLYFQAREVADECYKSYILLRDRCKSMLCDEEDYILMDDLLDEYHFYRRFARKRLINIAITLAIFTPTIGYTADKARKLEKK